MALLTAAVLHVTPRHMQDVAQRRCHFAWMLRWVTTIDFYPLIPKILPIHFPAILPSSPRHNSRPTSSHHQPPLLISSYQINIQYLINIHIYNTQDPPPSQPYYHQQHHLVPLICQPQQIFWLTTLHAQRSPFSPSPPTTSPSPIATNKYKRLLAQVTYQPRPYLHQHLLRHLYAKVWS